MTDRVKYGSAYRMLLKLGRPPHRIATTLRRLNIKGLRNCVDKCPVAMYLDSRGYENLIVDGTVVQYGPWDAGTYEHIPKAVTEFIRAFDTGDFEEVPRLRADELEAFEEKHDFFLCKEQRELLMMDRDMRHFSMTFGNRLVTGRRLSRNDV